MFSKRLVYLVVYASFIQDVFSDLKYHWDYQAGSDNAAIEERGKISKAYPLQYQRCCYMSFILDVIQNMSESIKNYRKKNKTISDFINKIKGEPKELEQLVNLYENSILNTATLFRYLAKSQAELDEMIPLKANAKLPAEKVLQSHSGSVDIRTQLVRLIKERLKDVDIVEGRVVNWPLVGKYLSRLLISGDYVCLSVQDLSLMIFRLFYLKIIPQEHLQAFFMNFFLFNGDNKGASNVELQYRRRALYEFFGFNIYVIMGIKSETAEDMFKLFMDNDSEQDFEKAVLNFCNFYDESLGIIDQFEDAKEENHQALMKALTLKSSTEVKNLFLNGLFLMIVLIIQVLHLYIMFHLKIAEKLLLGGVLTKLTSKMIDEIEKFFPTTKTRDRELKERMIKTLKADKPDFHLTNFDDFLGYFENVVKTYKESPMAKVAYEVNRFNDAQITRRMLI